MTSAGEGAPLHLTLVRHGVTAWNTEGRWQGHSDTPLSAEGEAQARLLARRLRASDFDEVHCSDLQRAVRTANLALPGAPIILDPRLREGHFGAFDARTQAENEAHAGWAAWLADPWRERMPDGESFEEVGARALAWANELPSGQRVIAFAHSVFIRALICTALGIPVPARGGAAFPFPLRIAHASLTRLHRTPHGWDLVTFSDVAHLESWADG
ncbi:histidine phosphatase family protein [Deinococcus maricopensis]|uniref:Phosphoglycerate mutase n=1 Tax=Deinococcus maricopensis (strain DSM 21211 / LMG 22137 / NRRL B-23946 / LB-34) TaxID=709986 RepID=E8U708_DEIML|nr:histidine phosphatase family protein [Deinococcus maricopensis]ADV66847.1 Phosphoglycerate mutase [Deinococcus maricopensis DSM 21211]